MLNRKIAEKKNCTKNHKKNQKGNDRRGTRTPNLVLRRHTPYPVPAGHNNDVAVRESTY